VLEQAIVATKGTDQKAVGEYIRQHSFDTIIGKVTFAPNGEWATSRMLMVQYQNISGNELEQFYKPGKRVILYPEERKSGTLIFPYTKGK
jgi:branched-chain amino acid transport system substrate-binding protein